MSQNRKIYSEDEIYSLLYKYYHSDLRKSDFCRLHHLSGHALLNKWLKKYGEVKEFVPLPSEFEETDMANRSKESYRDEIVELKKRIKELEKSLAFSQLQTEARDLMITRAEEYYSVSIRKKSGAK